jgi:SAM-dependent methyltransferase
MGGSDSKPKVSTVLKALLFHVELAAWLLGVLLALGGAWTWAALSVVLALAADVAGRLWSLGSPVPMPYFMRWVLHLPRGPQSPAGLARVLQPRSGERILEVGPGVGVHALPVASALLPDGILDVLDVQQEMLDELARRADARGLTNVVPRRGDAGKLPYLDRSFDGAYLISVLGEIPDPVAALRELRRVLKPDGRLVVGEVVVDPDFVSLRALDELSRKAGFRLERSAGPRLAYLALLRPTTDSRASPQPGSAPSA